MLASGGSRGLAHIGAIEVLEERGFEITSVSGASMGALVGGVYAADTLVSLLANSDATLHWLYLGPEEHAYYRGYLAADPLNALARAKQLAETATSP